MVNSIQKAGTHMLTEAVDGATALKYNHRGVYDHALSRTWPVEKQNKNSSASIVVNFFKQEAWPGEILRGHIAHTAEVADYWATHKVPNLFIYRKPQDVLLSLANWWERHDEIKVTPFLRYKQMAEPNQRLRFLVTGHDGITQLWPNFIERMTEFAPWLQNPGTLSLRYEDLLNQPEAVASELEDYLPLKFNRKRFLHKLTDTSNRTYTRPEEKYFKTLPKEIIDLYDSLGGKDLNRQFGYHD
jgi:hypothetical protein